MKQLKLWFALGAIFVSITGTLSHFLYSWTGENFFVGLFSPVSESVWEHMKLLFFPMLLSSAALRQKWNGEFPCIASALCFGILAGTFFIPAFFYGYTAILGKDIFFPGPCLFFPKRYSGIPVRLQVYPLLQAAGAYASPLRGRGNPVPLFSCIYLPSSSICCQVKL